jgi:hypothetical protein
MNALELAKEFEEYLKSIEKLPWGNYEVLCDLAVTKLRQQQESIEGLNRDYDLLFAEHQLLLKKEWVSLTDEEILAVNMSTVTKLIDEPIVCDTDHNIIQLGKAIEAKLKEKNT